MVSQHLEQWLSIRAGGFRRVKCQAPAPEMHCLWFSAVSQQSQGGALRSWQRSVTDRNELLGDRA